MSVVGHTFVSKTDDEIHFAIASSMTFSRKLIIKAYKDS
jgi:hypothetical protein